MSALRTFVLSALVVPICIADTPAADIRPEGNQRIVDALGATDWIYTLDSARIDVTIRTTRPSETVELNKRKFVKELRDIGLDVPDEIPEKEIREREYLQPSSVSTLLLSWDRKRLVHRYESPNCLTDIAIWDGLQGREQLKWGTRQNGFALLPKPPNTVNNYFGWLPWAMTADHYAPLQVDSDAVRDLAGQRADGRQDESALRFHSTVMFDGTECELYARPEVGSWERFYVEKATGRLRGMHAGSWGVVANRIAFPFTQQVLAEEGITVATSDDAEQAVRQMPALEQEMLWKEMHARLMETYWDHVPNLDPVWTITLGSWREVQAGQWFPFHQQQFSHSGGMVNPQGEETRIITVDRFEVNQPLDEELLVLNIDEGADVYDETHDPPLRYTQDSHRTPGEWAGLIAKARESQAENVAERQSLDELIGAPAPEFPEMQWLHTDPLKWQTLAGRYVILDFWHVGCGPCWSSSIPYMSALHGRRDDEHGVTVIGIHGAGVEPETVSEELAKRIKADTSFPICIDQALEEATETDAYPSTLFSQFHVRRMPYAWLVDPDGKLIAHGDLASLHEQALELMRSAEKK